VLGSEVVYSSEVVCHVLVVVEAQPVHNHMIAVVDLRAHHIVDLAVVVAAAVHSRPVVVVFRMNPRVEEVFHNRRVELVVVDYSRHGREGVFHHNHFVGHNEDLVEDDRSLSEVLAAEEVEVSGRMGVADHA
jgi:hypothetical protein